MCARALVDESYAQSLLVLEQCLSSYSNEGDDTAKENSTGMVLLAMSTLLSERFKYFFNFYFKFLD